MNEKEMVAAVVKDIRRHARHVALNDLTQTVWHALLLAKTNGCADLREGVRETALMLIKSTRDEVLDTLRRVALDDNVAAPRIDENNVDVALVVRQTLKRLDDRDGQFFRRHFLRGETYAKIAADWGCSITTVARRVNRAATLFTKEYNRATRLQ